MRLIDADALYEALREAGMVFALHLVETAPAIAPPRNDPLTLDELRELDGEPVWIDRIGGRTPHDQGWAFVCRRKCLCRTTDGCNAFFELYGISWLAYRRKPEVETV